MAKRNLKRNKSGNFRGMVGTLPKNIKGKLNGHWKGGIQIRKDGYTLVRLGVFSKKFKGQRYKLRHRFIMEQYLKRPLKKNEIVHHKNGNTSDNRIENLEIMLQSEHARLHLKQDKKTGRFMKIKK